MSRNRDTEDRRRRAADKWGDPYAKKRREEEERRAEDERHDVAPPERDDWTAPTASGESLRRVSAPDQLDELLPSLIADRGWGDRLQASAVVNRWEEIAGPELAKRCEAVRVAGGTLVVRAVDQTWATQLKYMTRQLATQVEQHLGTGPIQQVRILVEQVERPDGG